jgi:PAS domain S-box-containing protein
VRDAAQETADEEQLQLARTLQSRFTPEQLAALVEVHRAVAGHLDRRSLFTAIAQALQGLVPVSRSLLLLPSSDPAALTIYASYGKLGLEFYQGQTIARAGSIPGWVGEHGRPFVLDRAEHIRGRFPVSYQKLRQWGMESVAVVPLLTEGRCVGALSLMSEQVNAWSGVSSGFLEEIAASMAVALEHCIAYEEVSRLRDEQAALLEINRAVARHLHRDELFATLADCLRDLLPSDRFGIELPVGNGKLRAHVLSSRNAKTAPVQIEELPSAGTACRWTEETRQWLIASSREELRERFPVTFDVMKREGMQSVCAIPLLSDERSLGVLFFMAAREAAFHELRRDLLDQVGSAVAVALDHCLAYEEVRDLLASQAAVSLENTRLYGDLQEREAKVRRLVDNALDAVLSIDEQGRITEWNAQAETMFGWRHEEAVGRRLSEMLIPMRYRSAHEGGLRHFLTSGEAPLLNRRFEITAVRRNGREFPVEVSIASYRIGGTWAFSGFVRDITERKRAEEALRESEKRYALAMRASGVGHWDWKIASDEFYASARLLEICGFPPDTKFSRRARIVDRIAFHPDDRAQYEAAVAAHFAGETPRVDIVIRIVPHGEIRWLHVIGMCSRDADGKPVRWAGSLSDITERKRADEALRTSEARFRSLTELSSDWYWEQDENLRFTYMSDQAAALGGFSPESSIGKLRWELPGITPLSCSWAEHQAVLAGRQPFRDLELSGRMPDGSLGYYAISGAPIFDGGRRFRGYQGIGRSITERKRIEEALKLSEERYARAMEAAAEGHWDWDTVTDEIFVSPRMKQLFGLAPERQFASRAEFIALQPLHPGDRERLNATVQATLAGAGSLYEMDYRIHPRPGKTRWLRARGKVFRDAQGNPVRVSGSVTDITERKRAEAERLKLEERLRQAEKMEAIGRLAGGIAHDFNNVLGGIFAYGEILYEEAPESSSRKRHARNLLTAAARGRALVEQILAHSRSQSGKREPTDIGRMVAETLELVRGSLPPNITVESRAVGSSLVVMSNPTQLHQVIMNLCSNAIHALGKGGTLRVALAASDVGAEHALSQGRLTPGRYACLTVADNGCGMDAATLARIFEPFFTTKEVGRGTGLGLSLVYGIVTNLGGAIDVKSAPAQGSTFAIYLPLAGIPVAPQHRLLGRSI